MKRIVIEGWRFLPHSYAIVNHWHCLELLKRPDVQLFHTDVPPALPAWRPGPGVLDAESEAKLATIPARPSDPAFTPDAVLRIGWPHWFHRDPSGCPTFVWGTTEFKNLEASAIGTRRPPAEELARMDCTIIASSNWARVGFVKAGAPPERVVVNACGVEPSLFHPLSENDREALRKEMKWEGRFVALNVSAMTQNKGIAHLLHAVGALAAKHPSIVVCLKGTDSLYTSQTYAKQQLSRVTPELAAQAARHTAYLGQTLSTAQMIRLYQAADLYVSPYLAEGFNLPVLESAACGLPSICTAGGSTEDFIDDSFAWRIRSRESPNRIGFYLEPELPHLIELMDRAIGDPTFRQRARESGPAWVRERFTWKQSVDRLMDIMFPRA
jgi:glycosyltransferase involved in cell wall biosynthesis